MTVSLADQIAAAKHREWAVNAQDMAARFNLDPLAISKEVLERHEAWARWCADRRVCSCPAQPAAVATFLLEQSALGASTEVVIATLKAIQTIHDFHNLSNPCATRLVNHVLEQIVTAETPNWNKDEKAAWAKLPMLVREAISRRERDRDRVLRTAQNRAAESRKAVTNGTAKSESVQSEGNENHGQTQQG